MIRQRRSSPPLSLKAAYQRAGLLPATRSGSPSGMENPQPSPHALRAPRVSFVSLGCPKALVDSERIITRLRAEGYELVRSHSGADLAVVNTCGFLDSAQAESLAAIRQALNENGKAI